jgi:hypothetical protein
VILSRHDNDAHRQAWRIGEYNRLWHLVKTGVYTENGVVVIWEGLGSMGFRGNAKLPIEKHQMHVRNDITVAAAIHLTM